MSGLPGTIPSYYPTVFINWCVISFYCKTCPSFDNKQNVITSHTCTHTYNIYMYSVSIGEGNGTHSSTLAWKIPWMEEPGGLQSMRSLKVGHDWATSLWLFTFMHWRRQWQPTPVFLPGESQGRGSLVGCCLRGRTELDTTEAT